MNKSAEKVKLTSFDDLFGTASLDSGERVTTVPLSQLHTFKEHPFRVADDEKMQETVESIKQYGVLMPGIVRPYPAGGYEVIAGHRRFPPYVCTVSARLFEKEAWYIRLILEGEDRLFRNLETKEQNHTVSYHFVAEDWQELADAEDSVFDCVIQREMIRNVLGCLTGRQRRVMEAYAVEGKTMKEVAKELGITVTAVSWLLIRGRQRILREYPSLDRKGQ